MIIRAHPFQGGVKIAIVTKELKESTQEHVSLPAFSAKAGALEEDRAVMLGAPLYIGRWLKGARRFLKQHQEALRERPVAIFTLGPTRAAKGDWQEVRAQLDAELAKYP